MQRELDRVFARVETAIAGGLRASAEDATIFKFDLPGMTADGVKVGVAESTPRQIVVTTP